MNRIRHTGIYVRDLEMMISFYKETFGLRTVIRQREGGAFTDMIFGEEGTDIDVCKLAFADDMILELIRHRKEDGEGLPDPEEKIYRCGKMHIAVTVDSAQEMYQVLKEKGCVALSEPDISPDGKACVFFARDPEGNYLELVEEL